MHVLQLSYDQHSLIQSRSNIVDFVTQDIENFNAETDRSSIIINIKNKRGRIIKRIQESFIRFRLNNLRQFHCIRQQDFFQNSFCNVFLKNLV